MDRKEFVPYEIALELKKFGFKEECDGYYYHDNYHRKTPEKNNWEITTPQTSFKRWYNDSIVLAILWQQAFDWFRTKCNLDSYIQRCGYGYSYQIYSNFGTDKNESIPSIGSWEEYDKAKIACMKKLIEVFKTKCEDDDKKN